MTRQNDYGSMRRFVESYKHPLTDDEAEGLKALLSLIDSAQADVKANEAKAPQKIVLTPKEAFAMAELFPELGHTLSASELEQVREHAKDLGIHTFDTDDIMHAVSMHKSVEITKAQAREYVENVEQFMRDTFDAVGVSEVVGDSEPGADVPSYK